MVDTHIKIEETTKPAEKKLVALEMSKEMWKKIRLEAAVCDLSFSAMVRVILNKHFQESSAKLNETEQKQSHE